VLKIICKPQKFWDSVLWSDETKLDLFGPMDQHYVWRKKNEAYAENNTSAYRFKHGGACWSSDTRNLQCVEDKMDSLKYQEILGGNVMLSVRKLKLGSHWTLQ